MGSALTIECLTNNLQADVSLLVKRTTTNDFVDAVSLLQTRLKTNGQSFVIDKLEVEDSGEYKCSATNAGNTIELLLGKLEGGILMFGIL